MDLVRVTVWHRVAHYLSALARAVADPAGVNVEGVPGIVLLLAVDAPDALALRAAVDRLRRVDAVGGHVWAAVVVAADPAPSQGARALSAAVVYKVRVALGHLAVLESGVDAIVVLVALARAAPLQARDTTAGGLQHFFNAVVQLGTVGAGAVGLAQANTRAVKEECTPQQRHCSF